MTAGDVEISTLLRSGEWSEETLADVVKEYEHKIAGMGATPGEIKTHLERTSRGGVKVRVVWDRTGDEGVAPDEAGTTADGTMPAAAASPTEDAVPAEAASPTEVAGVAPAKPAGGQAGE